MPIRLLAYLPVMAAAALVWLHQFNRLRIRWQHRADIGEVFGKLACCLICWRHSTPHRGRTPTRLSAPRPYFPSMTPNGPCEVLELTVALDYGQFYLIGQPVQHASGEVLIALVETATKGAGIASSEGNQVVVVLSPHQNNFAMRLRVELWATAYETIAVPTGTRHGLPGEGS